MLMKRQVLCLFVCSSTFVGFVTVPPTANGCGFCFSLQGNPFALPHPKTIEIAVATRTAIDKGHLKRKPLVEARTVMLHGSGLVALEKVPAASMVAIFAKTRSFDGEKKPTAVHFLFVDTSEASGLQIRNGVALVQPRPIGSSDARIVTTKVVFHALLTGQMSLDDAKELGLLIFEGGADLEQLLFGDMKVR